MTIRATILYWSGLVLFLAPSFALAQRQQDLTGYLIAFTSFFDSVVIPFLFALAVLFFFVNVTRYFVIQSDEVEARETARTYALYAVIAMVIITSIWGIIEIIASSLGIDGSPALCPDYIEYSEDCRDIISMR